MKSGWLWFVAACVILIMSLAAQIERARPSRSNGGVQHFRKSWTVLEPIKNRNLCVYPVVSDLKPASSDFLTPDEGLSTGSVRITERGEVENALYRRRSTARWPGVSSARHRQGTHFTTSEKG